MSKFNTTSERERKGNKETGKPQDVTDANFDDSI